MLFFSCQLVEENVAVDWRPACDLEPHYRHYWLHLNGQGPPLTATGLWWWWWWWGGWSSLLLLIISATADLLAVKLRWQAVKKTGSPNDDTWWPANRLPHAAAVQTSKRLPLDWKFSERHLVQELVSFSEIHFFVPPHSLPSSLSRECYRELSDFRFLGMNQPQILLKNLGENFLPPTLLNLNITWTSVLSLLRSVL